MEPVAILYQHAPPPIVSGISKPMKPGGYSDSGADIGYCLHHRAIPLRVPRIHPRMEVDLDWVFPDSVEGIEQAYQAGARIFWLNTVLYASHPITQFFDRDIQIVGQSPSLVDRYDDKLVANAFLQSQGLPVPPFAKFQLAQVEQAADSIPAFPVVLKPIRGRGSQGVSLIQDRAAFLANAQKLTEAGTYGDAAYWEPFLPGKELTLTVMPPDRFNMGRLKGWKSTYWSLPPVARINHSAGIAPYNGTVAVVQNSAVISPDEIQQPAVQTLMRQCERAAQLIGAQAPIRIDCRADSEGNYQLFDVNLKPNMTGASRPHRREQDSLTMIATRVLGWDYGDLLERMLNLRWRPSDHRE
ncbi:hypothetical protein [Pontibacter sp. G13]|uniref:hypothetical protein n=1 Tax=Pontibacter sp. G13 TaxID=3074898 RepID=UPI00288BEEEA|nr:hypothetical protein [Pontibacter sp. G13]WNJ18793.1 hypothetical protein RJD25_28385 [Pontibacter sp. G13]